MKHTFTLLTALLLLSLAIIPSRCLGDWSNLTLTTFPSAPEVGAARPGKYAGIFYFVWLTGRGPLFDNTKILAADPANPKWGPLHSFHFWGEPLFGHYRSDDEFVLKKHAQMLSDADIDVAILDVTNAETYDETRETLCRVWSESRRLGNCTPQIAFITHSHSARTVQHLYDTFYAKNLYPDLWFRWQGKPLILAAPDGLPPEVQTFFTFRESWAWTKDQKWFGDGKDKWPWIDRYPQTPGWHDRPDKPEAISVCIAGHPLDTLGRSFHDGKEPPQPAEGACFAEQWRRALEVDPDFIFVTGWNEWIAQRFIRGEHGPGMMTGKPLKPGDTFFVDQFNQEFSRDAEPMRGGHGDAYYYQLIANIRRFKGAPPIPPVTPQPITIDGKFDDWKTVVPEYHDETGDPVHRKHPGWQGQPPFVNDTGRNDIVAAKVSYDAKNVHFYVRTKDPLTPSTDPNRMRLLVGDYVFRAESPGAAKFAVRANEMELAVPLTALGITKLPATLDFKWIDNIPWPCTPDQFTTTGDAAPNDRFYYRAILGRK